MTDHNPLKALSHILPILLGTLALILAISVSAQAQSRMVKGTVVSDEDGEPIPGASVIIKGTTIGTITDLEGRFSLTLADDQAVISVSFVGFQSQDIAVGDQTEINVSLSLDITALEEVVVMGYGSQKKKVVTAATVKVTGETLEKRLSTNVFQAMQGSAAGVSIRSSSGQPGDGFKVNIRGLGTIGNAGPLYIVDGVQTGDIKYLNNADIESIDVLKDAASAAIYGSRAANGVVLITTKKGKPGRHQITFDSYYGIQNRAKKIDMLNAREYAQVMNQQHLNSGGTPGTLPFTISNLPVYTMEGSADTDWIDEMFVKNAITENYTIGFTGGSQESVYSTSLSYTGQEGILGGKDWSDYERFGARINTERNYFDGIVKVGENMTFSYIRKNGVKTGNQYDNTLRGAFNTSPLLPMHNDARAFFNSNDKEIFDQFGENYWNETESNPYASMTLNNQNKTNEQKLFGNVYVEVEPIRNLRLRSSVGVDLFNQEYRSYRPAYALSLLNLANFSKVEQKMSRSQTLQFDNYATYDLKLGNHNITAMVGMSSQQHKASWLQGENTDLVFDSFKNAWLVNATNTLYPNLTVTGSPGTGSDPEDLQTDNQLLSYFSRITYDFQEKYLFNATFRADGSSKFAKGNQWGFFPSVSAGWVLTEENFLQDFSFINFAKLRASWGQNGNQDIPNFQYVGPISFENAFYSFGEEGQNTPGSFQRRLGNENIKWETSEQIDIGLDLRVLNNRASITVDWYKKSTIDWLIEAPILATAGAEPPYINGGRVENTGVELEIAFQDAIGEVNYSVSLNGAYNKNEVKEVPTEDETIHGQSNHLFANSPEFYQAKAGHPIGYFWGFEMDGIFQNTTEVREHTTSNGTLIQPNAAPGDVRYVDRNDDGRLNDLDKIQLGNPNPPITFGFNLAADYKSFDLSIMCFGTYGNDIVQSYRDHSGKYSNYTTDILDSWNGEGTSNSLPRVTNSNTNYIRFSKLFIQDGSYLRIGNVTLGYDLKSRIRSDAIGQLRVYGAVNNLYTFTNYTGMDPDVGYGLDNGEQDKFSSGIDLGFYPNPRTYLVGVSMKF